MKNTMKKTIFILLAFCSFISVSCTRTCTCTTVSEASVNIYATPSKSEIRSIIEIPHTQKCTEYTTYYKTDGVFTRTYCR